MKKYFYILLSLAVLATACNGSDQGTDDPNKGNQNIPNKGGTGDPVTHPHYVLHYMVAEEFHAAYSRSSSKISVVASKGTHISYDDDTPNEYEALCEARGDKGYDKPRIMWNMPGIIDYTYLADDIAAIDLVADREWNEIAPGESWNEFCWLKTASARRHIESGYTYTYDWTQYPPYFEEDGSLNFINYCSELEPITKPLTECTAEDLQLIWLPEEMAVFDLYLTDGPFRIEDYRLTLRITTASGTVFDTPVKII